MTRRPAPMTVVRMAAAIEASRRTGLADRPQAAWVARKNTDPFFAYDANYLIDNKAGIIADAEGTRANRRAEIAITETMIERIKDRFDLQPRRLAGDTVYGAVRCSSGWWTATSPGTSQSGTSGAHRWHLQPGRLRLRPTAQHLHLPEWKAAAHHRNSHRRQYASLCLKARLRCLRVQNAVLPPHACAADFPRSS